MLSTSEDTLPYPTIITTGLLYGLSFSPFFLSFSLGFLAWFCWIPLFIKLSQWTDKPKHYFLSVGLSFLLGSLVAAWWLIPAISVMPYILAISIFAFTRWLVFIPFYALQYYLGWRRASYLLPFLWSAWEWLLTLQDLHSPLNFFFYTQADYNYLIQYSDLTGLWGISFWLVLLNIVLTNSIINFRQSPRQEALLLTGKVSLLFIIPLLYGHFTTQHWQEKLKHLPSIKIALLQPNFNDEQKKAIAKNIELMVIDSTQIIQAQQPDLMVWPESAILGNAISVSKLRDYLLTVIGRWNTPLLFGFLEHLEDKEWHWDKPMCFGLLEPPKNNQLHNSALLLTPQLARYAKNKKSEEIPLKIYRKQHPMPFTEKVPFADIFPALQKLAIESPTGHQTNAHIGKDEGYVYAFLDKKGKIRRTGIRICYEVMYPRSTIKMLQKGAEMLVILSNDSSFAETPESYRMQAYTRMLSITLRRSIARDSSTGVTFFTNPLGQVYGDIAWWKKDFSVNQLKLNSELSFYTRYPDLFSKLCLLYLLLACGWFAYQKWIPIKKN